MALENLHQDIERYYLFRKLQDTPENERAEEAIGTLRTYDKWYPENIPDAQVYVSNYGLPEKEWFEDRSKCARDFFKYILSLDLPPNDRKWVERHLLRRLEKEEEKSRWLYDKFSKSGKLFSHSVLRDLPHHQLPPYIYDWRGSILGDEYRLKDEWLKNLTFTKKVLGHGGFSYVYLVKGPENEKYTLKLFHPSWKFLFEGIGATSPRGITNERIIENVKKIQPVLSEFPKFPKIRAFSPERGYREKGDLWYIMDFIDGTSAQKKLFRRNGVDDSLKKTAVREYASMLKFLHPRDFVFYDNNWGAMMIGNDSQFNFIDFDLVTKVGGKPAIRASTRIYSSEEQFGDYEQATKTSDLEGFAKMIDHLYVGTPFIKDREMHEEFKKHRRYPEERKKRLPKSLAEIVERVIVSPENYGVTIDDFCHAIEII